MNLKYEWEMQKPKPEQAAIQDRDVNKRTHKHLGRVIWRTRGPSIPPDLQSPGPEVGPFPTPENSHGESH